MAFKRQWRKIAIGASQCKSVKKPRRSMMHPARFFILVRGF